MLVRGYMMPMRPRVGELFDDETIGVIFSNIEQLHQHHGRFKEEMEAVAPTGNIAVCFSNRAEDFKIYSVRVRVRVCVCVC